MEPSYSSMYESSSPSDSYHEFNESKKHRPNYPHVPTAMRRNERERNRVKLVNMGFTVLRQHVPNGAKNKKMSKVETLRSAVDYIKQLQKLLGETQSHELLRSFNRSHENVLMSQCSRGSGSSTSPSSSAMCSSSASVVSAVASNIVHHHNLHHHQQHQQHQHQQHQHQQQHLDSSPASSTCQLNVTPLSGTESTGPSSSSPNSASSLDTSELGSSERSLEGPVEDDLISFTKWFS